MNIMFGSVVCFCVLFGVVDAHASEMDKSDRIHSEFVSNDGDKSDRVRDEIVTFIDGEKVLYSGTETALEDYFDECSKGENSILAFDVSMGGAAFKTTADVMEVVTVLAQNSMSMELMEELKQQVGRVGLVSDIASALPWGSSRMSSFPLIEVSRALSRDHKIGHVLAHLVFLNRCQLGHHDVEGARDLFQEIVSFGIENCGWSKDVDLVALDPSIHGDIFGRLAAATR